MQELSLFNFDKTPFKIDKPIRLIELFAGIGSQAKALERLGADFEHYRVCEFDKYAITSYNAIHGTNFATSDITKLTADDLGIVDTDKYCYIMTYSFPCQDLSLAGKQKGMAKGENTRSGLLWEVERLLNECDELPQVLLMENVTQVHGTGNVQHFAKWIEFLESKGYSNYWKDMNAKNFGIPQNRDRCFMVSILGDYRYEFPQEFPLKLRLKDMLEDSVDEKYYIDNAKVEQFLLNTPQIDFEQSCLGTCHERNDMSYATRDRIYNAEKECPTLTATMFKDAVKVLEEPKCDQVGMLTGGKWDKMHDISRRVYSGEGVAPTLHTCGGGNLEPKVIDDFYKNREERVYEGVSPTLRADRSGLKVLEPRVIGGIGEKKSNGGTQWYQQDRVYDNECAMSVTTGFLPYYKTEEPVINVVGNYSPSGHDASRVVDIDGLAPTVKENHGTVTAVTERFFKQALETLAENDCSVGDTIDAYNKKVNKSGMSPTVTTRPEGFKTAILPVVEPLAYDEQNGYIRKDGTVGTLTTDGSSPKHNNRVIESCYVSEKGVKYILDSKRGMATDVNADICQPLTAKGQANWTGSFVSPDIESLEKSSTIGGTEPTKINLKDGTQITSNDNLVGLRIRKLTPKECYLLMGFDPEDYEKAAQFNSNSQLYKQAGNSIVVDVLVHIFKQMLRK